MKNLGFLTATLLLAAACSSSKKPVAQPEMSMTEPMTDPTPSALPGDGAGEVATEPSPDPTMTGPGAGMKPEQAAEAAQPTPPPPPTAAAHLVAVKDGAAVGVMTFQKQDAGIVMSASFTGLPPGPHAFYIHEVGDCTKKGAKVGKHLDPTKAKHGPPSSSTRHAGDLGNLTVDADGNAMFEMTTDSVVLDTGRPDSILLRAIVIHAKKDDARGNAGPAIACGVIDMVDPTAEDHVTAKE